MDVAERKATGTLASKERIALVFGSSLLIAGVVLVTAVMPAEYAVDPLGVGTKLGLTKIGAVGQQIDAFAASRASAANGTATIVGQPRAYQHETIELKIAPHDSVEYKYRLDKGQALLYSWRANTAVNYEFHAEPDGAPAGYAETYEKRDAVASAAGTLTTPFSGIHGWYWENTGNADVTVTLSAAGFYNMSHEFRKNAQPKTRMFQ